MDTIRIETLTEKSDPLWSIRNEFEKMLVDQKLEIVVPHRDMAFDPRELKLSNKNLCFYLPDHCAPPHTFSLRHVVEEALNAICPQAPDGFEGLNETQRKAIAEVTEGQNLWKMTLHIDQNHIIAVITKMSAFFLVE